MKFTKKILKNGLVVLHEKRDVPVTTVMLASKYGSAYESESDKGVAHFIEHLCFKGTKKRNTLQIASEVEKVGGILNAFTHEEVTAYHVKLPSDHLALAMDVIFDIYFNPIFPEEDVKREAFVICEEIKMYKDHPRAYVLEKLKEGLYEKPFGMFIAGTESNVKSFSREKILKIHRETYCPENSILCVVGNNSFSDVLKFAKKYSSEIEARTFRKKEMLSIAKKNLNFEEKRANLEQANLAIGFHFPLANSEEKYSAEVFNTILGGGMSSRLFTEVREKRGLAYAVKTELDLGTKYGYFLIYIGTDKNKVDEVIKICLEEFYKMENVSEKELEEGKQQLLGNKKVHSEEGEDTAVNLVLSEIHGKAEDYYGYDENIKKVAIKNLKNLLKIKEYSLSVLVPQ
ncbi:insulinase family protein [Candidatus Pacearchaeota archaeon]|nr:insulinase family protein [Candidatus Pacearchaeota archaeon]